MRVKLAEITDEDGSAATGLPVGRGRRRSASRSPWTVAGTVLLIYVAWTLATFQTGLTATDFALVGVKFAHQSTRSSVITFAPNFRYGPGNGYDGQFCYYIALDPVNARYYIDTPAYRYERILYPLVARALALGQPSLVPYTLILVNLLAISGCVLLLAFWLRRRKISPWLAVVYGLYSGVFVGFERDLTEPLAYFFVMLAVYLYDFRRSVIWAGICFGLATLARETALIFALPYIAAVLLHSRSVDRAGSSRFWRSAVANWRPAALMLGLAAGPFLIYKLFLTLWIGGTGVPGEVMPRLIPFSGLIVLLPWRSDEIISLEAVAIPGVICLALSLWAILKRRATIAVWALLLNVVVLVLMLNASSYYDSGAALRVTIGVVLAALLSIPAFDKPGKRSRRWLAFCAPVWVSYTVLVDIAATTFRLITHL